MLLPPSDRSENEEEARESDDRLSASSRICAPSSSRGYILLVRGLSGCSIEPEDSEFREGEKCASLTRFEL